MRLFTRTYTPRATPTDPVRYTNPILIDEPWPKIIHRQIRQVNQLAFPDWEAANDLPPAAKGALYMMAQAGKHNDPLAYAVIVLHPGDHVDAVLEQVAVCPAWQGHGIGHRLVHQIAATASTQNYRRVGAVPLVGPERDRRERWLRSVGLTDPWYNGLSRALPDLNT